MSSTSDEDRGPALITMYWVFVALSMLAVGLRYYGRRMIRQTGWDDHMMAVTLVCLLGLASLSTVMCGYGGAKHIGALDPDDLMQALRFNWAAQPFVIFGFATGKISIGLLILRIIGPNTVVRKWLLYVTLCLSLIFSIIDIILTFAQCSPPQALWIPSLITEGKATCLDTRIQSNFALFLGCWNVAIDVMLAVLPITIFYNLKISGSKKISCSILLGLGLVAAVCGSVKAAKLSSLNARSDLTWETFPLFAWSGAELFVLIFCGSVPPMKPLYDRIFRPERMTRSRGYHSYSHSNDNSRVSRRPFGLGKDSKSTTDESAMEMGRNGRGGGYQDEEEYEIGAPGRPMPSHQRSTGILRTTEVSVTSHAI